jgi:hypothetical protein
MEENEQAKICFNQYYFFISWLTNSAFKFFSFVNSLCFSTGFDQQQNNEEV